MVEIPHVTQETTFRVVKRHAYGRWWLHCPLCGSFMYPRMKRWDIPMLYRVSAMHLEAAHSGINIELVRYNTYYSTQRLLRVKGE